MSPLTYCSRLFVVLLLNMMLFVGSQSYNSPPSFMFVSAAVSEISELNQNKKKKEKNFLKLAINRFNTFPGHIIYPPEVPFDHMYTLNLLEVLYTTN